MVMVCLIVFVMSVSSLVYVSGSSRCLRPASTYLSLSWTTMQLPLSAVLMMMSWFSFSFLIVLQPFLGRLRRPEVD